jgi:3-dehydroquinate synthase
VLREAQNHPLDQPTDGCPARGERRILARVAVEVLSRDLVHTIDAIELPVPGAELVARAERRDSYPIVVTRSPEETIERLLQEIGNARVAVITDETVAALYGPLVVGALQKAGLEPEVATVPSGERHKTVRQACDLLDWLTGTQIGRRDVVVTLGGGVVIDMGGWGRFVAHTSQLTSSVTSGPLSNSSAPVTCVGTSTGMRSPRRGPTPIVRSGKVARVRPVTRLTGPSIATSAVT